MHISFTQNSSFFQGIYMIVRKIQQSMALWATTILHCNLWYRCHQQTKLPEGDETTRSWIKYKEKDKEVIRTVYISDAIRHMTWNVWSLSNGFYIVCSMLLVNMKVNYLVHLCPTLKNQFNELRSFGVQWATPMFTGDNCWLEGSLRCKGAYWMH